MDNSASRRQDLASRLRTVRCDIDTGNSLDWLTSGSFQAGIFDPDLDTKATPDKANGSDHLDDAGIDPNIIVLPPRVCVVRQAQNRHEETLIETDEHGFSVAVVSFRIAPTLRHPARDAVLSARIDYVGLDGRLIHKVGYGQWLDEDFNWAEISVRDTRELVLAIRDPDGRRATLNTDSPPRVESLERGLRLMRLP